MIPVVELAGGHLGEHGGEHGGATVVTRGLVVKQRTQHQITGEPMKFLTLADGTGMVATELFAQTCTSYGRATVRHPVLEATGRKSDSNIQRLVIPV